LVSIMAAIAARASGVSSPPPNSPTSMPSAANRRQGLSQRDPPYPPHGPDARQDKVSRLACGALHNLQHGLGSASCLISRGLSWGAGEACCASVWRGVVCLCGVTRLRANRQC
jgi:hypothetical protein